MSTLHAHLILLRKLRACERLVYFNKIIKTESRDVATMTTRYSNNATYVYSIIIIILHLNPLE